MSCNGITILGCGAAGAYLTYRLSKCTHVNTYEGGIDRRFDGFTYNLALLAPTVHNPADNVASFQATYPAPPAGNTQWAGVTFQLPYTYGTTAQPSPDALNIPAQNWTQGWMIGGSSEHIQGVYVNPSQCRCDYWAELLKDDFYSFQNLFPKLVDMEKFRSQTIPTVQTFDSSSYAPYDGPSAFGSLPRNRGYDGLLQCVQSAPSSFSKALSEAIYKKFNEQMGIENFVLTPIVNQNKSYTFNSGVNVCVTESPERFLDIHRNRVSTGRNYLNSSVMRSLTSDYPSIYITYNGTLNNGPYVGINGHDFRLTLGTTIQRIVFKTKPGYPAGQDYWLPEVVDPYAFERPLKVVGVEYGTSLNERHFIPVDKLVCCLGTLATPALLMQSGVGPAALLESKGIPVLLDNSNIGKYVATHSGTQIKWTGNPAVWHTIERGYEPSNGYLPGPDNLNIRKFQYFSGVSTLTTDPANTYTMNLYDLMPHATGHIEINGNWDTNGGPINITAYPNFYSGLGGQYDKRTLCWIVRRVAEAIHNADPGANFIFPAPYPFSEDDNVLFPLLTANFVAQQHFVGTCGMGLNPDIHPVDTNFKLRGTKNLYICDGSSTPLEVEKHGVVYPVQNDGNTLRGINAFSLAFADKMEKKLNK